MTILTVLLSLMSLLSASNSVFAFQLTTSKLPERIGFSPEMGTQLPLDAVFRTHDDREIRLAHLFGDKPVLVLPVYYRCPMLCGLELKGLVRCLRGMSLKPGVDFDIVTFSIDPREGPALARQKRKAYLAELGQSEAEQGWSFLTGDEADIQRLCDALGFRAEFDPNTGQYAHAAGLVISTPDGRVARYFYGVEFLPRDMKLALMEASQGEIGTLAEHIQLYCYMYDPTSGKYGIAILAMVRLAGVATVIVLVASVVVMLRRDQLEHRRREQTHG